MLKRILIEAGGGNPPKTQQIWRPNDIARSSSSGLRLPSVGIYPGAC